MGSALHAQVPSDCPGAAELQGHSAHSPHRLRESLDPCPSVCLNAVLGCASKQQLEQLHLDEARGAATGCLLNQEGLSQQ